MKKMMKQTLVMRWIRKMINGKKSEFPVCLNSTISKHIIIINFISEIIHHTEKMKRKTLIMRWMKEEHFTFWVIMIMIKK